MRPMASSNVISGLISTNYDLLFWVILIKSSVVFCTAGYADDKVRPVGSEFLSLMIIEGFLE